ncbi:phosphate acyltransferase PlsX [Candidatus Dependentiae bacterium]
MIAVDAMGGDNAPEQIVKGSLLAAKSGIAIKLFGKEQELFSILDKQDLLWRKYNISVCDSSQIIHMEEEPVAAVKRKSESSLVKAIYSVKKGVCSALVSAGNSGAVMVCSTLILGKQNSIERPAILGILPIKEKKVLCLDIGANVDCKPSHLVQFAFMANDYAKKKLDILNPRVALLSNGHEEGKGNKLVKQVYSILKDSNLNFVGNIEPYGIFKNHVDIVVSDGFYGNILLKTIESCAWSFGLESNLWQPGGAILVGVNGTVIIAHGNAFAEEIKNAILLASKSSLKEEKFYGKYEKFNKCVDI